MVVADVNGRQLATSAILDKMTPRQLWVYKILTGQHELDDQIYSHGNGWLCSINEAADGKAIWNQLEEGVDPTEFDADAHRCAISMWLKSCVDPFIYEV